MSLPEVFPVVKPLPDRSSTLRFWQRQSQHYQALGVSHILAGQDCPFPRWSFAGIHWRKGVQAAIAFEIGGAA